MFKTVGNVARELSHDIGMPVSPKQVSMIIYDQRVAGVEFPLVNGRRLVPLTAVNSIRMEIEKRLARRGGGSNA